MSFLEFPIKRYPFTLIAFLGLIALGVYSFSSIARSEDPYFPIPAFVISAILPGGDPVEMERLVSKPIEDALSSLEGIEQLQAASQENSSFIIVELDHSARRLFSEGSPHSLGAYGHRHRPLNSRLVSGSVGDVCWIRRTCFYELVE